MAAPGWCRRLCRLAPWLAAVAVAGCHHAPPHRGRLHCTLTVDGVPLAKGQIRILALTGGGVGTAGEIADEAYDIPPERGPTAGTYRVEFVSLKPTGRRVRDADTNELIDELVNVLPACYHSASTLQTKHDPSGDPTFNFELKSK